MAGVALFFFLQKDVPPTEDGGRDIPGFLDGHLLPARAEADAGLNVVLEPGKERQIFARYRFVTQNGGAIDMRPEDSVILAYDPDGNLETLSGENRFFYPLRIFPNVRGGTYRFQINGRYEAELVVPEPGIEDIAPEVQERIAADGTRLLGYALLAGIADGELAENMVVDMTYKALLDFSGIWHLPPGGVAVSLLDAVREDRFWIAEDVMRSGEHLFLFRKENFWSYVHWTDDLALIEPDSPDSEFVQ
jgi:hypothetical protein